MMEHLTETQLNEYLDNLMEATTLSQAKEHLAECADCRERLSSLQTIFQALEALPEELPVRDLTSSIIHALPTRRSLPIWQVAIAIQAGLGLGLLLLLFPLLAGYLTNMMVGLTGQFVVPEVKFPNPIDLHFSLPVFHLPHASIPVLPIPVTPANFSIWLILGIAASLLFIIGNLSLVLHSNSNGQSKG
jgi:predicted anti-sigma-YlaC factor YlaD